MNMCLKMLFTLSLSGTALILVLLGATRIFGSHMGRRWQYYIWLAAVFRLLLPIPSPAGLIFPDALKSGMSVGLLSDGGNLHAWMDGRSGSGDRAGQPEPVMEVRPGTGTERLAETGDMEAMAFTAGDTAKADTAKTDTVKAPGLYLFLLTLWLSVAAVLMGRRIWNYRSTARLCKRTESLAVAGDGGLEAYGAPLEEACRVCGLNRRPRLVVSRTLPSPVTMGLLSSCLLIFRRTGHIMYFCMSSPISGAWMGFTSGWWRRPYACTGLTRLCMCCKRRYPGPVNCPVTRR